jgi:predicted RNase H-like HicB family nuclease
MSKIRVEFALNCHQRMDEEAGVFVGYIPALRLYSQGRSEEELKRALMGAAEMFIVRCYEREILGQVLRSRGMTKAAGRHSLEPMQQYIHVAPERNFDKSYTVHVPIDLLAAHQLEPKCLLQ